MDDPPSNSIDPAVVPATKAKNKKAPQGTKKSRLELTLEEIAKLDAESAKRRNRWVEVKRKDAADAYAIELVALEAARQKGDAQEKEDIMSKAHTLLMMGLCRPTSFAVAPAGPTSTGSSVVRPPQCPSLTSSTTPLSPDSPPPWCQAQTRLSMSPKVSVIAPSTARPSAVIDLNVTPRSYSDGRPSVETPGARHNVKSFTLTHCWQIIINCPKFKINTVDDKRDAASYALHGMTSQKEVRGEKKRQGKEEQMKQYMELQTKKLEMEEVTKKRKIDMEEAARQSFGVHHGGLDLEVLELSDLFDAKLPFLCFLLHVKLPSLCGFLHGKLPRLEL
ncbi:subtilisin-like protease [Hordeum vulgare]|nr:subtilisin-like protease [Hordeum vulgare]